MDAFGDTGKRADGVDVAAFASKRLDSEGGCQLATVISVGGDFGGNSKGVAAPFGG